MQANRAQQATALLHKNLERYLLLFLLASYILCCWLFFADMLVELHGHWVRPNDLDAGYLLLGFAVYLFWQSGRSQPTSIELARTRQPIDFLVRIAGGLVFLLCLVAAALASISATKSVALGLLVVAFVPLCLSVRGTPFVGDSLHGTAIVFMATPLWFVIVPGLQALTVSAVNWLLQRGRWPVFVEDNLIFLPQGALEIVAGCAGLKFVQTALALTLIEGFTARRSLRAMVVIGATAFVLALLCNWLRVAAITLLALYLDLQHPWVTDHNWVGWVLFVLLFGPLFFWLGGRDLAAEAPAAGPENSGSANPQRRATAIFLPAALALGVGFGTVWALNELTAGTTSTAIGQNQLAAVQTLCEKETYSRQATDVHPAPANFAGAQYSLDCALGNQLYLSLRGYVRETQGSEVVNPANELLPGLGQLDFVVVNAQLETTTTGNAAPGLFASSQVQVAYGYYAAQQWTAKPAVFKFRSLLRPLYPGPAWALIVIGPAEGQNLEAAFNRITRVMQQEG